MKRFGLRILVSFLFSIYAYTLHAQQGIPYISFLDSRQGYEANNWSLCQDDHNAMLFASKRGLLRYDGTNWQHVSVPYIPHIIKLNPYNHKVYIVSGTNYGCLERDEKGLFFYEALTFEDELEGRIHDVVFTDSSVIFIGENSISCHHIEDHLLRFRHHADSYGDFAGAFAFHGTTYLQVYGKGLFQVRADTITEVSIAGWEEDDQIIFSLSHADTQVLLGTTGNLLLIFDGTKVREYSLSNTEYLKENVLSNGLALNDTCYAFSTSYGGVLLVDKQSGKVTYTLNYESGLPDDEIYAIGKDKNNGLWLTYGFGTCRVDLGLPVKDFSNYPGIEGLFINALWHKGELYIATTEGLFCLSEVKNFEEVEIVLRQQTPIKEEEKASSRMKRRREEVDKDSQESKGFLSRIFKRDRKKERDEKETNEGNKEITEAARPATSVETKYIRKKVSKLKSIEHVFKKIPGITSRCEQLTSTEKGILVGSSSGLYLVEEHEAVLLESLYNIGLIVHNAISDNYFILSDEGAFTLSFDEDETRVSRLDFNTGPTLFSLLEYDSAFWISSYDIVYKLQLDTAGFISSRDYRFSSHFPEEMHLALVDDLLYIFSESGIYSYSPEVDSFLIYHSDKEALQNFSKLEYFPGIAGQQWLKLDQKMLRFDGDAVQFQEGEWSLFENITCFYSRDGKNFWIIDDYAKIYRIRRQGAAEKATQFKIFLESAANEDGENLDLSELIFDPHEKMINIKVSAPFYLRDQSTQYQYKVEGKMERWSSWSTNPSMDILLDPGEHTIHVRAQNILGQLSDPLSFSVVFKEPFYNTTWFYLAMIPLVLGLLYMFFYLRTRKLRKDKRLLELKVKERTKEIERQKEKIEVQKDEIMAQKDDITSSITYASRIQRAVLPSTQVFDATFSDYFIFFKPRDIVSGDFYWISEFKQEVLFAAADCTGHGVPGAFMSMLGNSFLNEITKGDGSKLPVNQILNRLRDMVNTALTQSGEMVKTHDGMDMTLCRYNKRKKELEFAGAYNPLYHVRKGVLTEYKGDRMPIGFHPKKKNFKAQTIKLQDQDVIYMFSDGFPDQFGGAFAKKYTTRQFKQILTAVSPKPMSEQHSRLEVELETWQGHNAQVDDILIIGIRI